MEMKKTTLAALAALAAACGGNDGLDPASVKFSYGAGTVPPVGSDEAFAVETTEATLALAPGMLVGTGSVDPASGRLMALGDAVAADCMWAPVVSAASNSVWKDVAIGAGTLAQAAVGTYDPACMIVTPGRIEYHGCSYTTLTEPVVTITEDGFVAQAVAIGTGQLSWDLRTRSTMAGDPSVDSSYQYGGTIAIDASTIAGSTRSDSTSKVTATGMPGVTQALSVLANWNLHYRTDPFCLTAGTLEVHRVFTERPTGATASDLPDQGVLFTWEGDGTACGVVKVAWGTRQ
jgi:hypothetical protein